VRVARLDRTAISLTPYRGCRLKTVSKGFADVLGGDPRPGIGLLGAIGFVLVRTRRPIAQTESTTQRCSLQDKSRAWLCHPQDGRVSRAASDLKGRLQARLDEVHPSVPAVCVSARR
jgi:hypothetical protein